MGRGLRYALGNLLAGPSQWKKIYSTGAAIAFFLNMLLVYIKIFPALTTSSSKGVGIGIEVMILELANAIMPLIAIAFNQPIKALLTVVTYIAVGIVYWTVRYEQGMRRAGL